MEGPHDQEDDRQDWYGNLPEHSDPVTLRQPAHAENIDDGEQQHQHYGHAQTLGCERTSDIALAQHIGPALDNAALAAALNQAGHRTGTGQPFDAVAAGNLRHYHHIPYPGLLAEGELTPRQIADRTGVSTGTLHYWINAGFLPARRGPANRWCIPFPPKTEAACQDRAASSAHQHRDIDPQPRRDTELSVADVAARLGVKPDVIYTWAQWGHIPSRRSHAGRLWINFTPAVEQTCLKRITSSYKLPDHLKTQAAQHLERTAL